MLLCFSRLGRAIARLFVLVILGSGLATSTLMATPASADGYAYNYYCDEGYGWKPYVRLDTTWMKFNGCPSGVILINSSYAGWIWMYGGACSQNYYDYYGGRSLSGVRDHCRAKAL